MSVISKSETSFEFDIPGFEDIPEDNQTEAADDVAQYLIESILDYIGDSKSPVAGGSFKAELSKAYAEREGKEKANLDLNGDMLNALTFKVNYATGTITIGIFEEDQAIKSFNHNTGDTLPQRQFIPGEDELLKAEIIRGVGRILEEYNGQEE